MNPVTPRVWVPAEWVPADHHIYVLTQMLPNDVTVETEFARHDELGLIQAVVQSFKDYPYSHVRIHKRPPQTGDGEVVR